MPIISNKRRGAIMTIEEACECLNMAEDLLGDALCYLEGNEWKMDRQAVIDQMKAYLDFKRSGRSALQNGQRGDGT